MNDLSSSSSLSYKFHPSNVLPIRSIRFRRLESAFFSEFSSIVTAFAMTSSATRARHANGKCLNEPRGIIFLSLQFRVCCCHLRWSESIASGEVVWEIRSCSIDSQTREDRGSRERKVYSFHGRKFGETPSKPFEETRASKTIYAGNNWAPITNVKEN